MMKPRITSQVSAQEMLNLRGQGMTNHEIAESLEISYATVLRYIGKSDVPRKGSKAHGDITRQIWPAPVNRVTIVPPVKPVEVKKPAVQLPVLSKHVVSELQGCQCVYKVDSDLDYIEVLDSNGGTLAGFIKYDDIPKIIKELESIADSMKK